jgi:hypothetical protein
MRKLIKALRKEEPKAVARVMAFMSYNPSIGRVLEEDGVEVFQLMAVESIKQLDRIRSLRQFDSFHESWIKRFVNEIHTNTGKKCSVGQAQKAINVFLKVYVDWALLPKPTRARRLRPFLHVPLDRILMKSIAEKFPRFFNERIRNLRKGNYGHSLSKIGRKEYDEWQVFFRRSYSRKPILFDLIWALNRRGGGGT